MKKVCAASQQEFLVTDQELEFYERMGVPLPSLCPEERARKRLVWRNERTLYRRKCDATGKMIVSIFDETHPFPVYNQEYWWANNWDALEYGREFDFSRPFFEQFLELFEVVPQCALRCPQSENSEFTNQCENNKDCYLVFCSNASRECLHGMWYQRCEDCIDCTYLEASELCYEILNGNNCYHCTFSENLQNCSDCHLCRDCIGCSNCFLSVNLRNKEYYFRNEKLTAEDYQQKLQELELQRYSALSALKAQFEEIRSRFAYKYYAGKNNEDFSGDYIENNKNAFFCYNCRNSENIKHCRDAWGARNCIDMTETLEQDFCLELEGCYANVNSAFCAKISQTSDCWYCSHCFNSQDLFGCVGMKKNQYCILNRQYSKSEYFELRKRIIAHMKETGEWGEYFPLEDTLFAYNESVAQEYFPLTQEEVQALGLRWKEPKDDVGGNSSGDEIPDSIHDVSDSILDEVLLCENTGRPFKLQKAELIFYRKLNLPIPRLHPDVRHLGRMNRRNPRKLWARDCDECGLSLESTFAPARDEQVLCEECYGKAVD